jgi:hypothetical protein
MMSRINTVDTSQGQEGMAEIVLLADAVAAAAGAGPAEAAQGPGRFPPGIEEHSPDTGVSAAP